MEVNPFYQFTITKEVTVENRSIEKWVRKGSYYSGGFLLYPIVKNTRLHAILKRIIAALFVRITKDKLLEKLSTRKIFNKITVSHISVAGQRMTVSRKSEKVLNKINRIVEKIVAEVSAKNGVDVIKKLDALNQNLYADFARQQARITARKTIRKSIRDMASKQLQRSDFESLFRSNLSESSFEIINSVWEKRFSDFNIAQSDLEDDQNILPADLAHSLLPDSHILKGKKVEWIPTDLQNEKMNLQYIREVITALSKQYTCFVPSNSQTAPVGDQAANAKLIYHLDILKKVIDTKCMHVDARKLKSDSIRQIDVAIRDIASYALGAAERGRLYELARKGFLSKNAREILQPVLFEGSSVSPYIRTTHEVCKDVLAEIGRRLQKNPYDPNVKLLKNIQSRYKTHIRKLRVLKPTMMDRVEARHIISLAQYEFYEKKTDLDTLVRRALANESFDDGETCQQKLSLDNEGLSDFQSLSGIVDSELLNLAEKYGVKVSFNKSVLSGGERSYLKKNVGIKIYKRHFFNSEYESYLLFTQKQKLKFYKHRCLPKGYESWIEKSKDEKSTTLKEAYNALTDYVKLPAWFHCTQYPKTFENIIRKGIEVLPAVMGTGSFASTNIESSQYGGFCFALDEREVMSNVPVISMPRSDYCWVGYSDPLFVSIYDKNKKWLGLDVAYIAIDDADDSSLKELENNTTSFNGQCMETVKSVYQFLRSKGMKATVVSINEANLEKSLINGNCVQLPSWEPGFKSLDSFHSEHPILYKRNKTKYQYCE